MSSSTEAVSTTSSGYSSSYDVIVDCLITTDNDVDAIEDWTATRALDQSYYRDCTFLHGNVYA